MFSDAELAEIRKYADGMKGAPIEVFIDFLNGGLTRLLARLDAAEAVCRIGDISGEPLHEEHEKAIDAFQRALAAWEASRDKAGKSL